MGTTNLDALSVSGGVSVGGALTLASTQLVITRFTETVSYGDFTDNEDATGSIELANTIPAGAYVLCVLCTAVTGFAGDTSATVQIGDGTDVDRYNAGTPDVFSDVANGVALGDPSGTKYHAAEATITVTVTTDSDFTSVSAGALTLEVYYIT